MSGGRADCQRVGQTVRESGRLSESRADCQRVGQTVRRETVFFSGHNHISCCDFLWIVMVPLRNRLGGPPCRPLMACLQETGKERGGYYRKTVLGCKERAEGILVVSPQIELQFLAMSKWEMMIFRYRVMEFSVTFSHADFEAHSSHCSSHEGEASIKLQTSYFLSMYHNIPTRS